MLRRNTVLFLFLASLLLSGCLFRETRVGSIAGTIVIREELADAVEINSHPAIPKGYVPLKDATVTTKSGRSTKTNQNGYFLIDRIPEGREEVTVTVPQLDLVKRFEVDVYPGVVNTIFYPVGKGYYIIIGIGKYLHLADLNSADANAVEAFFASSPNVVKTIRDEDATRANIEEQFAELKKMLSPEDFLVIYFSGHGHQGLLALYGYSEENREEALDESDLKELLSQMPTENITLIVDACNSGSLFDGTVQTRALKETNYVILASSQPDQNSYQYADDGGLGYFTKHFLLGLLNRRADYNKDGRVTSKEIFTYVYGELTYYASSTEYAQTPTYHDPLDREPVIYRY